MVAIMLLSLIWVVKDRISVPTILFAILSVCIRRSGPQYTLSTAKGFHSHGSLMVIMACTPFEVLRALRRDGDVDLQSLSDVGRYAKQTEQTGWAAYRSIMCLTIASSDQRLSGESYLAQMRTHLPLERVAPLG